MSWKTMLAGFHYIRSERLILGSISLDLFAVLLAVPSHCFRSMQGKS